MWRNLADYVRLSPSVFAWKVAAASKLDWVVIYLQWRLGLIELINTLHCICAKSQANLWQPTIFQDSIQIWLQLYPFWNAGYCMPERIRKRMAEFICFSPCLLCVMPSTKRVMNNWNELQSKWMLSCWMSQHHSPSLFMCSHVSPFHWMFAQLSFPARFISALWLCWPTLSETLCSSHQNELSSVSTGITGL